MLKKIEYRVTNHEWYAIVRSFMIVGVMFFIIAILSFVFDRIDPLWLHFTIGGTIVKAGGIIIFVSGGAYFSVICARKLFDKMSIMAIEPEMITITRGSKVVQIYLHDISDIKKRVFAAYDDKKEKDSKIFGPMYAEYIVTTSRGVFCQSCSVAEGWEKMEKKIFNKEGFLPKYTIDEAYGEIEKLVKERKARENGS